MQVNFRLVRAYFRLVQTIIRLLQKNFRLGQTKGCSELRTFATLCRQAMRKFAEISLETKVCHFVAKLLPNFGEFCVGRQLQGR